MMVTASDKKSQPNLWDADIEALIALLALRLSQQKKSIRATDIVRDLNYKYLRKRLTTPLKNCSATLLQRSIIYEY